MERIRKTGGRAAPETYSEIPGFATAQGFGLVYSEGLFRLFVTVKRGLYTDVAQYVSDDLRSWRRIGDAVRGESGIDSVSAVIRNGKIFLVYVCGLFAKCKLAQSRDGENFDVYPVAVIPKGAPRGAKLTYSGGSFYLTGNSSNGEITAFRSPNCIVWEPHNIKLEGFEGEAEYPNFIGTTDGCYMFYARGGKEYCVRGKLDAVGGVFSCEGAGGFYDYAFPTRSIMLGPDRPMLYARFGDNVVFRDIVAGEKGLALRAPLTLLEARKYTGGKSDVEVAECFEPESAPQGDCAYAFGVMLSAAKKFEAVFTSRSGALAVGLDREKAVVYCKCGDKYAEFPFGENKLRFDAVLRNGYSEVFLADGKFALTLPALAGGERSVSVSADGLAYLDYSCYSV